MPVGRSIWIRRALVKTCVTFVTCVIIMRHLELRNDESMTQNNSEPLFTHEERRDADRAEYDGALLLGWLISTYASRA
jgi:hypothetical protein